MFDIGFLELIIVAVIALLVLGPERLPKAAKAVGRWVGKARRLTSTFSQEIDRQIQIDELKEQLKKQGQSLDITDDANKIHQTVSQALSDVTKSDAMQPSSETAASQTSDTKKIDASKH